MAKARKSKMIVREIKPKIKVIELEQKEEQIKIPAEKEEAPLEEIISDAPSSREFPSITGETAQQEQRLQGREQEAQPSPIIETTGSARYAIQRNVSEQDIARLYQSKTAEITRMERGSGGIGGISSQRVDLSSRETGAVREGGQEDEKYNIQIEQKPASAKRRYPWES